MESEQSERTLTNLLGGYGILEKYHIRPLGIIVVMSNLSKKLFSFLSEARLQGSRKNPT
jgi:hypothetical protein